MNDDEEQEISSEARNYFSMMPNVADDELSPHAYRLYGHYLRIAGGKSKKWAKTTAEKTGMSDSDITNARLELEEKGYIRTETRRVQNHDEIHVTLLDVWQR
jgi:DNA-binding MarR family transcriptional regulator